MEAFVRRSVVAMVVVTVSCTQGDRGEAGMEAEYEVPEVTFSGERKHPVLACTPEELSRLREAYGSKGEAGAYLAGVAERLEGWMAEPVVYPPRGKAHGQW